MSISVPLIIHILDVYVLISQRDLSLKSSLYYEADYMREIWQPRERERPSVVQAGREGRAAEVKH